MAWGVLVGIHGEVGVEDDLEQFFQLHSEGVRFASKSPNQLILS